MTTVIVSQLILQVITEVINIREGGPAGYVKIKTSVPPPLFCPPDQRGVNNSCYIRVTTHFQEQDGLCVNGNTHYQATIMYRYVLYIKLRSWLLLHRYVC